MYWCNLNKINACVLCCLTFALLTGCEPEVRQNGSPRYFDIKKYFTAEAARLNTLAPAVLKTVVYNWQPEQKTAKIKSWPHELALFTSSDINKPAWRNSYKAVTSADSDVYTAIDTNLKTRRIAIYKRAGQIKKIGISNFTKNLLYQTRENLTYYPDSVYVIEKKQTVRILGMNNYTIRGVFVKK